MCKYKKTQRKTKSVELISPVVAGTDSFKMLISNRSVNYRKGLYVYLNNFFPPGKPDNTWKNYYLYPHTIPSSGFEKYLRAMERALEIQIQKQESDLLKKEKVHQSKLLNIKNILLKISKLKEMINNN